MTIFSTSSRNERAVTQSRPAGHAVVEQLVEYGIDIAFAVPGESYLAVLDGLYEHRESIQLITTRQEGGAAMMAAAYGRDTGKPGACLVTRGPGATNASIGVHVASQDASPMLLIVGQVPERNRQRQSFQEIDYSAMFGTMAKAVIEIADADRVPEQMSRALALTTQGEPGPVVVVLPEDMLKEQTKASRVRSARPAPMVPDPSTVEEVTNLLTVAERPLIIAGRCKWTESTRTLLAMFAETSKVPVATAVRCQDVIDNDSPAHVGTLGLNTTPGLTNLVEEADVIVLLGTRPDALTMGDYELLNPPRPQAKLVHVYPEPRVFGAIYAADIAIEAAPIDFLRMLPNSIPASPARSDWLDKLRELSQKRVPFNKDDERATEFMSVFNELMPDDTYTTSGAGNYTVWQQRHRRFTSYPSQLGTQSGAMGYGIPAGVSAALIHPDRTVVAFAGDGCFMMNGQELATAAAQGLDLMVILINNSRFGTIRAHQDREYPGRVSGTDLINPDFVELCSGYGARVASVSTPMEFRDALESMGESSGLRVIEVRVD